MLHKPTHGETERRVSVAFQEKNRPLHYANPAEQHGEGDTLTTYVEKLRAVFRAALQVCEQRWSINRQPGGFPSVHFLGPHLNFPRGAAAPPPFGTRHRGSTRPAGRPHARTAAASGCRAAQQAVPEHPSGPATPRG